ncbi:hypothetical protein [Aeromonas hydrophila]|uniref:hypothetical protein n=1 Tax=Aeromonas hydrophila TaxID=644 RepID=UPI0006906C2C|nr:hypothetical protein [Aeromonas hydrophila]
MEINVPMVDFYVISENGWDSRLQTFNWDQQRKVLDPIFGLPLMMKNTHGGIKVKLAQGQKTVITAAVAEIYYRVEFLMETGYCALYSETASSGVGNECQLVTTASDGERRGTINLVPITPLRGWAAGDYVGVLSLLFESTP